MTQPHGKPRIARTPGPNGGTLWVCWSIGGYGSYGATPADAYAEWELRRAHHRPLRTRDWATAPHTNKKVGDDFEFMALCHAKGNPAMYELLRDRSADE